MVVGRSRRIDPIGKLGYLVVMLAFPLVGPLWTLWTVRGKSRPDAAQTDDVDPRPRL